MSAKSNPINAYRYLMILLSSMILGGLTGHFLGQAVPYLKPLGNFFLHLIFTAIVPLIFFSVSSAVARIGSLKKLSRIFFYMMLVFLLTSMIASLYALFVVKLFPLTQGGSLSLPQTYQAATPDFSGQLVDIFTVSDFSKLFSHEHILALILFSILVGFSTIGVSAQGEKFYAFLIAGEAVFMRFFSIIMYCAPLGFFAYFAVLVRDLGGSFIESYARIGLIYYMASFFYFVSIYTGYAYLIGKTKGVTLFWRNIFLPMMTSLATCSSAASIPATLSGAKEMQIPAEIYETVVPLGIILHKEGSIMGGIFKIAFLLSIFHLSFSTLPVLLSALGVSLLVGTVMGAIPSGGMLGELLILSVYGFPSSVLMATAAISIIIDPPATMLNVTGNSVSAMWVNRLMQRKNCRLPEC